MNAVSNIRDIDDLEIDAVYGGFPPLIAAVAVAGARYAITRYGPGVVAYGARLATRTAAAALAGNEAGETAANMLD